MMPKVSGPEMINKIQQQINRDIPVMIFISGYSADYDQLEDSATKFPRAARLKKPFGVDDFSNCMSNGLITILTHSSL